MQEAKLVYQSGGNVTQYLRQKLGSESNTPAIIEIAYELQAGSYVDAVISNRDKFESYTADLSSILSKHLETGDSLLDVGTGEITNLTLTLNKLDIDLSDILAFDLSWSRLSVGMKFHLENRKNKFPLKLFAADMEKIPLHDKCVDVVTSAHALEPNGNNLEILLGELFRVSKKKLVLFEPSYELNSEEGKSRMDNLGYIKDIPGKVSNLGGNLVDVIPINSRIYPVNPTTCYVIEPPKQDIKHLETVNFCVPGTNFKLESRRHFLLSKDTGLVFPVLDDIPILKIASAILATSKI